jgi:transcriptional regulator with XRE-family HTH domain
MDDVRLGARFRALRQRLGWRQQDVADRAGVTQDDVSKFERVRLDAMPVAKLRRIAAALDAELPIGFRWRGGDLDRLMDEGHASLVGMIAATLRALGWEVRIEVSYSVYGERGSIDVLAWHPTTRVLLVVEVKTELVAIEETLRKHDQKTRLAPRIATEQSGWKAIGTARLLVLPSLSTARRRVERHASVMDVAYPLRGMSLRRWMGTPTGAAAGVLFADLAGVPGGGRSSISRKRVRRRSSPAH